MSTGEHRLALPAGYELGKYRFLDVLGSGGFGITYLAEDRSLNRRVAIKELLPNDLATRVDGTTVAAKTRSDEETLVWARERFVNEGRALAACDHQNVVDVYEMIEANNTAYMVTKYEEGRSLEQWLRDLGRRPDEAELRGILLPLLSGLQKVHATGFLHRDIKPENIYLTTEGRPVLLDFGSARQAISNRSLAMTSIVTSGYAPFEQYYEDGNQGPWSDIYALGAVMYRAITGKKPPEATRRLKDDPCERLAARYLGVYGAEFLKAIDSALLMNESMRPQSVAEWCGMLGVRARDAAPLLPIRTPLSWVGMIHRWAGMIRRLQEQPWLGAAAIVTALVCVAGAWELFKSKPVVQPDKPAAISSPPGATAVIAQGNTAVTAPATGNPSPPQPASVPGSPTPAPAAPSPTPMPESQPADSAAPAPPPKGQESATVDSRLVGSWETGSTKSKRERWDLWANGHWIVSGPANDAGTFTTADGHIDQFSNITQQSADLTYEFDGDILVTHSPSGTKNWRRMDDSSAKEGGEEPSSVTKTQSRRESGSHESHSTRLPEVGRKIGRILRSRF